MDFVKINNNSIAKLWSIINQSTVQSDFYKNEAVNFCQKTQCHWNSHGNPLWKDHANGQEQITLDDNKK